MIRRLALTQAILLGILSTLSAAAQRKGGPTPLKLAASSPGEKSATVAFSLRKFHAPEFRILAEPGTLRVVCTWEGEKPLMLSFSGAAGHGLPGTVALQVKTGASPLAAELAISPEQAGRGPVYVRIDRVLFDSRSREHIRGTMVVTLEALKPAALSQTNEQQSRENAIEDGRLLSGAEVAKLEATLRASPHDWLARLSLLSYYTSSAGLRMGQPQIVKARRRHILWMVQNRPAAPDVFILPELQLTVEGSLADPEGIKQAGKLWRDAIVKHPNNVQLMGNAAAFLAQSDASYSEGLLKKLQAAHPENPYWSQLLGWVYATAMTTNSSSAFSRHAREELSKSQNADVLDGAAPVLGWPHFTVRSSPPRLRTLRPPNLDLAEELAARAVSLDAQNPARLLPLMQILAVGYLSARTPQEKAAAERKVYGLFQHFDDIATDPTFRTLLLPELGRMALNVDDGAAAKKYASEALKLAPDQGDRVLAGLAVGVVATHDANDILGRVALRAGDMLAAKEHLLAAGEISDRPPLSTVGPRMDLAQELLERGERDAVMRYLDDVARFWKSGKAAVKRWQTEIRAGKTPRLNLVGVGPLSAEPGIPGAPIR